MAFWLGGIALFVLVVAIAWLSAQRFKRKAQKIVFDLESCRSETLQINGFQVHYLRGGSGPPLVLLHGIGASVFVWRFILPKLCRHFTVYAFDLPGFGRSSRPADGDYGLDAQAARIALALEQLGIQEAFLVGSSMGGTIALWLSLQFPQRFPRLAVLAPATDPGLIPVNVSRLGLLSDVVSPALNKVVMKQILKRLVQRHELLTSDVVEAYLEPYQDGGESIRTFLRATKLLQDQRLPHALSLLQSSCLLLWGAEDRLVARNYIEELHSILPKAELKIHPKAGHHPMEDEPDWVIAQLEEFFTRRS